MTSPDALSPEESRMGEITPRSVVIGLVACGLVSVWVPHSEFVIGASRLNLSQLPVAATGFFFGVILLNTLIGLFARPAMLKPAEMLVIFVMAFIASVMASSDMLNWPMGIMSAPYYFATPENRWIDDVWPHLRPWANVPGPGEHLRWAFVGKPDAEAIPWSIWFLPMFWWGTFIAAVGFGSICLASILRRQWADHERLAYPLAQVPLDLMSNPGGRLNLPEIMRTKAFWVGAGVPLFVILFNCISYFNPQVPRIPLASSVAVSLGKGFPDFAVRVNMYVLGFAYMVNTNVLLSVWLWNFIIIAESGICERVGFSLGARGDPYSSRDALTSWQGYGGFIVFVAMSLWMARGHLRHVWLATLGRADADDDRELLPYRWSVIGGFASAFYMAAFLVALGMSWAMALVFLGAAFVAYLGTARVVAQTGLVYMQSPLTPNMYTLGAFGTVGIPAGEIVGMVGAYSLVVNGRAPLLPAIFHISWIGAKIGRAGRRMFLTAAIGLSAAFLIGAAYYLLIAYTHGSTTFTSVPFSFHGEQVYDQIIKKMQARVDVDWGRWTALGIGAAVMSVLTLLQYRLPGWPVHPVGFPIAAANNVHRIAFTIFVVWLIKSVILRMGGVALYERARPVFLGIIAGYALGVAISYVIDWAWFPGAGHPIHGW